jgi:hypothetical protein
LKLKGLMLTKAGKKEAEQRHNIMVAFLRWFFAEQELIEWSEFLEVFLEDNDLK